MRSGPPGDESRNRGRASNSDVAQAEDFLFHLHRGSEMLLKNRVLEAKEELERALQHQPQDAKSQDLLAGVYFRLGVYPRAIEIWSSLVDAYPTDATLRVNLALAYFKTGQSEDALDHVHGVLRIQPDHERAWGYLGLINWRRGKITEARDAFLRGGQASMARRMEELLAEDEAEESEAKAAAHREAADDAARAIEDGPESRSNPPPRASALPAPGTMPGDTPAVAEAPIAAPKPLPTVRDLASLTLDPDAPRVRVDEAGRVSVRTDEGFCFRLALADAVLASAPAEPVRRRAGGVESTSILGGERPMHRFAGHVEARLRASSGRVVAVMLDEAPLFVLESRLVGFAGSVEIECNQIPLATEDVAVVRLLGRGEVLLHADAQLETLTVMRGREARVKPASLVGWTGAMFVSPATGVSPLALVLRGEGAVLLA